jgi:hypothetical protein
MDPWNVIKMYVCICVCVWVWMWVCVHVSLNCQKESYLNTCSLEKISNEQINYLHKYSEKNLFMEITYGICNEKPKSELLQKCMSSSLVGY